MLYSGWLLIFDPIVFIPILLARMALNKLLSVQLENIIGVAIYGIIRIIWNFILWITDLSYRIYHRTPVAEPILFPTNIHELVRFKSLHDLKVIIGFDNLQDIIIIDLDKYHTMVAGSTGSGKTVCFHMVIAQLVSRGKLFTNNYNLYLFDLKTDEKDYLHLWKAACAGYYNRSGGGVTDAIIALEEIADTMHQNKKRIVIFIDELSALTRDAPSPELKKRAVAVLQRLATQLRSSGALIASTQRPHFETVSRDASSQFERKIVFRVDDLRDSRQMIVRKKHTVDTTKLETGEFLMYEPGLWTKETVAKTMLMQIPQDIDDIMAKVITADADDDYRIRLIRQITLSANKGDYVPGLHRMARAIGETSVKTHAAYINFVRAGALAKDGKGSRHTLAVSRDEAIAIVVAYIRGGKWIQTPDPE